VSVPTDALDHVHFADALDQATTFWSSCSRRKAIMSSEPGDKVHGLDLGMRITVPCTAGASAPARHLRDFNRPNPAIMGDSFMLSVADYTPPVGLLDESTT
jgi:hypothetical protein